MNEAMAVCACSMIFCQKCSEGYVLIYCQGTFVTRSSSIYAPMSKKKQFLYVPTRDSYLNTAKEEAAGQSSSQNDCPITTHRGLNPIKVPLRRTQIPHLFSHVALNEIRE